MDHLKVILNLTITEPNADEESLDELTIQLIRNLRELQIDSEERQTSNTDERGIKGDPFSIGNLILVTVPTVIPQLIEFLQNWVVGRCKVTLEAPNGAKVEFTSPKKYTESEILAFIDKLNKISTSKKSKKT